MHFSFSFIKRLYKDYHRLAIVTDSGKIKNVDIEFKELIQLRNALNEYIEMNSLNVLTIE